MASPVTLSGGAFQDSQGNPLANGYLRFNLSQDGTVPGSGNISSGIEITITLDSNGNVAGGQSIWGNDVIVPVNGTFYRVTGYTAKGQPAWGPNNQQVTGASFNLSTWVPNQLIQLTNQVAPITLETNGTLNASQTLLNLVNGTNTTVTNPSSGNVQVNVTLTPTDPLQRFVMHEVEANATNTTIVSVGASTNTAQTGTIAGVAPSTTEGRGVSITGAGTASPLASVGIWYDQAGAGTARFGLGTITKFGCRVRMNTGTAGQRWWIGYYNDQNQMEHDNPNTFVVGFRYSDGVDTTWQAYSATSSANFTTANTGVAVDATASHVFEFAPTVVAGSVTSIAYFIDGNLVATITTNLPAANQTFNEMIQGDNKNVAVSMVMTFQWMGTVLKR